MLNTLYDYVFCILSVYLDLFIVIYHNILNIFRLALVRALGAEEVTEMFLCFLFCV